MLWSEAEILKYFKATYEKHRNQQAKMRRPEILKWVPPNAINMSFLEKNLSLECDNWIFYNSHFNKFE